jgi:TonB family protein
MEDSMHSTSFSARLMGIRQFGLILFNTLVLALTLSLAIPAYADGRIVKQRVSPVYPEIAKRMRVGGIVKLEVSVGPDGSVTNVKTLSGNRMLSSAAEEAVRKWRFAPGTEESTETIEMNFALAQ